MRYAIGVMILAAALAGCEKKEQAAPKEGRRPTPAATTQPAAPESRPAEAPAVTTRPAEKPEAKPKMLEVIVLDRDLNPGTHVKLKHIRKEVVPVADTKDVEKIIPWRHRAWLTARNGKQVNQHVQQNHFFLYDYVATPKPKPPSEILADDMIAYSIECSFNRSMSDLLQPGDRVNFIGLFPIAGGEYKSYRIFKKGVRLLNMVNINSARGHSGYRKLAIEIPQDVSLKLPNLLTHLSGELMLERLQNPTEKKRVDSEINPQLIPLTEKAKPRKMLKNPQVLN